MSSSPRPLHVLLVDDDPTVRTLLGHLLKRAGVELVSQASNGRDALEQINSADPEIDLVFLDLFMAKMDGIEVIRHVAERDRQPAFAFITGVNAALLGTVVHLATARGLRVMGALEKPVTPGALEAIIDLFRRNRDDDRPLKPGVDNAIMTDAVREEFIELHFQPKVDIRTGAVEGFESLARLKHPTLGTVPPGIFVPLAENSNLIHLVTNRVLMLALDQCAHWHASGVTTKVSVNLSAKMLVDLNLPDRIAREAKRHNIGPEQLILEITETGVFDDANGLEILARLAMKGFPLSIDDFGTGYSSLDQLQRVPFAELKIDRAFVTGAQTNATARAVLDSSFAMGRRLGLTMVAEGAESAEDVQLLSDLGMDMMQGYHIARPMPGGDVLGWLYDWIEKGKSGEHRH